MGPPGADTVSIEDKVDGAGLERLRPELETRRLPDRIGARGRRERRPPRNGADVDQYG